MIAQEVLAHRRVADHVGVGGDQRRTGEGADFEGVGQRDDFEELFLMLVEVDQASQRVVEHHGVAAPMSQHYLPERVVTFLREVVSFLAPDFAVFGHQVVAEGSQVGVEGFR